MLIVHHLNNSRSQRILWLLEELGTPYEIKFYQRDATTNLAPIELEDIHPLGKSPVIEDDGHKVAESGAVIDFIVRKHGGGRLTPRSGSWEHEAYLEWLHYAEGSAMLPLMISFYMMRLGEAAAPLQPRVNDEISRHMGYVNGALEGKDYLLGQFTGADVQLSFAGEVARALGKLEALPNVKAWIERLHARPAFKASIEKGGAYNLA